MSGNGRLSNYIGGEWRESGTSAYVDVVNPTPHGDGSLALHYLSVPPTMTTAAEAVAWTYGLDAAEYREGLLVRT